MADQSATVTESVQLLRSIDASLKALVMATVPQKPVKVDLDGQYGDPILKARDPRDWTGETMVGRKMSQCPAEYLDLLAERYDYFAGNETDAKKAGYNRLNAARCRGWAERIRNGEVPQAEDDGGPW
jgi:hypothetical protein